MGLGLVFTGSWVNELRISTYTQGCKMAHFSYPLSFPLPFLRKENTTMGHFQHCLVFYNFLKHGLLAANFSFLFFKDDSDEILETWGMAKKLKDSHFLHPQLYQSQFVKHFLIFEIE